MVQVYFPDNDRARDILLKYDSWMKEGDKAMAHFRTNYARLEYRAINGDMHEVEGIMTGRYKDPFTREMTVEFESVNEPEKRDRMRGLREPVYFMDSGQMIQATWGLIVHYAWEYTGDLKVFTEYTEDKVWKELEELDLIRYSEADYKDYINEVGEEQVEYWIVNEDDKIEQVDYYEYEMFHIR